MSDIVLENRPRLFAVIYIVSSIFIGPAIAIAGYVITPANGDYCDIGAHGSSGQRDRDYSLLQGIQTTGSIIMLTVGLLLLIYLWTNRRRISLLSFLLTNAGILVMAAGYLYVLYVGTAAVPSC
ncbi:hypothetical protein [Nocardia tenerifensis]|uniref:hypothetical protein n=1 Tax=Nocardia tenerifensis TaxID=228006 RepID=UPI00059439B7|nr:hypothetical protein [Nocardia tenerifensis]